VRETPVSSIYKLYTFFVRYNRFTITIGQFFVTSSDIYKIDISSLLTARTEISICVNMTFDDIVDDFVYITSREGYYLTSDAPQIIWTYHETVPTVPELQIPSYNLIVGW